MRAGLAGLGGGHVGGVDGAAGTISEAAHGRASASTVSSSTSISGISSPLVLVARRAITASATKKTLEASSARWNPEVSASGRATWRTSRWLVREVAMAEKTANPRAAPSWKEALTKEAARPALSGGTPALAAV